MQTLHEAIQQGYDPALFWRHVVKIPNGCWEWHGYVHPDTGYGMCHVLRKTKWAHRIGWELYGGPIPKGLVIDHLCRNKVCVRYDHLEPVTQKENLHRSELTGPGANIRKTHCKNGHGFTPENTRISKSNGQRSCRACHASWERQRRAKLKANR